MNVWSPFSLEYHNRDGGTSAAPKRRVPIADDGPIILRGDPMRLAGGVPMQYVAGEGTFGVAVHDFQDWNAAYGRKDAPSGNFALVHPTKDEAIVYRVQALDLESEVAQEVLQTVLGNSFDMAGDPGEMYLDVSAAGTDWLVIDILAGVSEWGDLYPILLVKNVNAQVADAVL